LESHVIQWVLRAMARSHRELDLWHGLRRKLGPWIAFLFVRFQEHRRDESNMYLDEIQ
jgi:hypothetical protein